MEGLPGGKIVDDGVVEPMDSCLYVAENMPLNQGVEVLVLGVKREAESMVVAIYGEELGLGVVLEFEDYVLRGKKFAEGLPEFRQKVPYDGDLV